MLQSCRSSRASSSSTSLAAWDGNGKDAILSPLTHDDNNSSNNVDNTLFNSVAEIPEQPSFISLDPNFDLHSGLNTEDNNPSSDDDHSHNIMMGGGGQFLPMLDCIEGGGGDFGLTDLGFNFA